MPTQTLGVVSDELAALTVLAYLLASLLLGWEFSFRTAWAGRAGLVLATVGLLANLAAAVTRALAVGRVPWGNMYEYSLTAGITVTAGYLVLAVRRPEIRPLGGFFLVPAVLVVALARFAFYAEPGPLLPALESGWLRIHVLAAVVGSALLTLASILAVIYLVVERLERNGQVGPPPPVVAGGSPAASDTEVQAALDAHERDTTPARRLHLPAASTLELLAARMTMFAFPIWTFAVIAGAVWAQAAWGRYWGWDPKETWSFISWVVYATYLHARATPSWRGRRAAWISVVGLVTMILNFYVINTIAVGLHSYSGL